MYGMKEILSQLDYLTLLRMRALINNQKAEAEWVITTHGYANKLFLSDGKQRYFSFTFKLNEISVNEKICIGKELAKDLGIRFENVI